MKQIFALLNRLPKPGRVPAVLLVAVAIALAIWSYVSRPAAEVYEVKRGTAVAAIYGTVRIEWTYSVPIRARNNGYIQLAPGIYSGQSSIGIRVKKDQPLATIVDETTSRALSQAKIDLEAAQARQRVGPADASALRSAQDTLDRNTKLYAMGGVSEAQMEQAKDDVQKFTDLVKAEQIEIDKTADTCQQNLKTLQDQLGRTDIHSPIDGVLTQISNNDGELVQENSTIFVVAQGTTYVSGQVNEEDVGQIREKMNAKVRLYSFPDADFAATVTSILPYPDPTSQRYTVTLTLDNPPPNLMAGMTGEMNVIIGERSDAILIPTRALLSSQPALSANKVFVVDGNTVTPRIIKTGYHSLETTEIVEGLREGERVIVADLDLFSSGERVRPIVINPSQPK